MSDGEYQSSSSERQLCEFHVCGITSSVTVDVHKLHPWAVSFTFATTMAGMHGRQSPRTIGDRIPLPSVKSWADFADILEE